MCAIGRRYHRYKQGAYMLPNDEVEIGCLSKMSKDKTGKSDFPAPHSLTALA